MSDKPQFVDTNILIYAHDRSAGAKHERARALLTELWESGDGCLSIQVLQEFYVNITRKVARPLSPDAARQIVADLGRWTIHSPTVDDVLNAIALQGRYGLSFWDAMVVASAIQLGCPVLWSEDLNDGQEYDSTRIVNPFQD
ncbi:MAG TPA: PIN domain-containing protein [Anaerolineae bacterium]|nr:PIN domain-containing protein [Anaerolineae bacterium]